MSHSELDILKRALERERKARKSAEKILEKKSRDLFFVSEELKESNLKLESLLNEKSSQLQGFLNNLIDAYLVMNLKGHVLKMNDAAKDLFGHDIRKERLNVVDLIYPEDEEYAFSSFLELTQKGYFSNYTARVFTKTKEVKWVQINASVIYNKDKYPVAAQGIIRDITQEKIAENLLIESKNRLSSLLVNLDSGVLLEDENTNIILTNQKFCDFFKIKDTPEQLIGVSCLSIAESSKHLFFNPKDFLLKTNQIIKNNQLVLGDEVLMIDGTILERDFIPIRNGNETKGCLWAYKDVSLKRKYRKSLENQKNKYSNIIANMNLGLVEIDLKGEILMVNQRLCSMSGYQESDLIGKRIAKIFPVTRDVSSITNQKGAVPNSYEIKVKNKQREIRNWLISGAPNYNLKGEKTGSIGICFDITDLKTLEKQKEKILTELEKRNDELHEYAHIVSHDLKSPLRSINALTSWIKSDNKGKFDDITLENFNLIEDTLEKMEQLISDVLIFSSAGSVSTEIKEVNLNELLEEILSMIYKPNHIKVKVLNDLPVVKGEKVKFQQLFQNLLSNAIKFSDKAEGLIEINVTENQSFYEFSVKDNGIGIEKKYHDKIFKIFHSLEENQDSTGIGLSIVKKIVDLYKGEVWLESEPKKGTTFYFTIKK